MNPDTLYYHQALSAYRLRSGDKREAAELPHETLSQILTNAQRRKTRKTNLPFSEEHSMPKHPMAVIATAYDTIALRLSSHYNGLRMERAFLLMLVLEDVFENDIREIARNDVMLFSFTPEDVTAILERR